MDRVLIDCLFLTFSNTCDGKCFIHIWNTDTCSIYIQVIAVIKSGLEIISDYNNTIFPVWHNGSFPGALEEWDTQQYL